MDPMKIAFFETVTPMVAAIGVAGVIGWVVTTWLRVRHGYPLESGWGKPLYPSKAPEADRLLAAMAEENRALRTELGELKNRVGVLERIATDPASRLDREIAGLGAGPMN